MNKRLRKGMRAAAVAAVVSVGAAACTGGGAAAGRPIEQALTGTHQVASATQAHAAAAALEPVVADPLAPLRATDWSNFQGYLDFTTDYSPFGLTDGHLPPGPYAMTLLSTQQYGMYAGHPVALVVVSEGEAGKSPAAVEEYLFTTDAKGKVRMLAGTATSTQNEGASMAESDFWCHGAFRLTPKGIGEFHNDCAQGYQGPYLGLTLVLGQPLSGPGVPDAAAGVFQLTPLGAALRIAGNPPPAADGSLITWNGHAATVTAPIPDVSAPDA